MGRDLHCGLKARLFDDKGGGRGVSDLWVVGDLRTLLFAGGPGVCELDFFACGWLHGILGLTPFHNRPRGKIAVGSR